ncbi:MAG: hypothetical protein KZQ83_07935 [gamma proteobacterium symbiont of Taylorina sp.]|nr:hypothetical protein [gamma proteobacterium symbiont of Taylorina sp.]
MSFFSFEKPKKTILNLLFFTGIVSFIISVLAIFTFVIWGYSPAIVMKVDKVIPDFYGSHIKSLYKKAKKSKDISQQYERYLKLYEALENVSILNKYYSRRQDSAEFLIHYYLKNEQVDEAMLIAEKWQDNYPYDFTGKFIYAKVLSLTDKDKALKYFSELYNKHKDIHDVRNAFVQFLMDEKYYNRAIQEVGYNQKLFQQYTSFQVFYNDNNAAFSQKQSLRYKNIKAHENNQSYEISFSRKFKKFKALRLDIDKIPDGSQVTELKVLVNGFNLSQSLDVLNMHSIRKYDKDVYFLDGADPYFKFALSDKIKNISAKLDIHFSLKVQAHSPIKKIIQHPGWQLVFGKGGIDFDKNESYHPKLKKMANRYVASNDLDKKSVKQIRFSFPGLLNLRVQDIKITLNNEDLVSKDNISLLHDIKRDSGQLIITGSEPYVVLEVMKAADIKNISVEIIFSEMKYDKD